jgi:hypothetical protein
LTYACIILPLAVLAAAQHSTATGRLMTLNNLRIIFYDKMNITMTYYQVLSQQMWAW